jgi:hypothetical protein
MSKTIPLRDYQERGVLGIYKFRGRALLADEMGLGKTIQALAWITRITRRPVLIVTPASLKWMWQLEALEKFHIHGRVLEGQGPSQDRGLRLEDNILIINYDILHHWRNVLLRNPPKVVILDECFLSSTKVLTDHGEVTIGQIVNQKLKVKVLSISPSGEKSWKQICHYVKIPRQRKLVKIKHEYGELICTENHPIWTQRGYIQAGDITQNDLLRMVQTTYREDRRPILQHKLQCQMEKQPTRMEREILYTRMGASNFQENEGSLQNPSRKTDGKKFIQENETIQPGMQSGSPIQNDSYQEKEWNTLDRKAMEKRDANQTPENTICPIRTFVESRAPYLYNPKTTGIPYLLQSRYRPPGFKNSYRNRRSGTRIKPYETLGFQEMPKVKILGVESFQIQQPGNLNNPKESIEDNSFVYCLEVEDNHNFFADGVLVSNCHYVKNHRARRSKAAKLVSAYADSVVGLSGTPMTNRPVELWSILNIILPEVFPDFHEYVWKFCKPRHTPWGWRFDGAEHKQELFSILREKVMIRRLKKHVAPELPDKIHKVIPFRLSPKKATEYFKAKEDFLAWLRERSPAKAHRAKRAAALVKVGYLLRLCCELKMNQTIEFIKEFATSNPGEQVVGMTGHTFVIDRLRKEFPNCIVVNGQVTGKERTEAVKRFVSKKVPFFWGNWKAAGTGLNLQVAHNLFVLDPPKTPGDLLQGQDRVHRIGQAEIVTIWYLILMGTVEEDWTDILRKRTAILKEILDGKTHVGGEDIFGKLLDKLTQ